MGIGVTFTLSVYLLQTTVLSQLIRSAPPDMPNVFLINITEEERGPLEELLRSHPGIEGGAELLPSVAARLLAIDGVSLEELPLQGWNRRFRAARAITWAERQPEEIEIVSGRWWSGEPAENAVSVREGAAEVLAIRPGSTLQWRVGGKEVSARVAATHRVEGIRPGSSNDFVLNRRALAGLPTIYFGGVRVAPDQAVELQRKAFELFPSVSVINAADVLAIVREVVDQIAVVIRFVSAFSILAGVIILMSSVAATRFRRIREVVVLKTLGATRSIVARIFSVEFLILGAVAGLMGSFSGNGLLVPAAGAGAGSGGNHRLAAQRRYRGGRGGDRQRRGLGRRFSHPGPKTLGSPARRVAGTSGRGGSPARCYNRLLLSFTEHASELLISRNHR